MSRTALFLLCFGPPFLYSLVFMVFPYINILQHSVWKVEYYSIVQELNLSNYVRIFDKPLYLLVLWKSIKIATIVTLLANLIGYPIAYYLAFVARRFRTFLYFLVIVPLWTSFLLRVFVWKLILGREGIINQVLLYLGLTDEPVTIFLYNQFSVCLALTYVFVPFIVLSVFAALEKIPREYIEASMDLGGSRFHTFRRIILPLSMPGVIAGSVVAFCLSFGEFVSPTLLGGASGIMISNVIIAQFGAAFDWPFGSALVVMVLMVILFSVALLSRLERRSRAQIN